jgi:putative selenium metabolism hydrolase
MNYTEIKNAAQTYLPAMTAFLRDLIRIPGEGCHEKEVISRIKKEMNILGFDKIKIDELGNILGFMGHGKRIIAFDGHVDTVGVGELCNWEFDPYQGFENDEVIGGRGASDQRGGIVSAVYGAKIMKDLKLIPENTTILVVGSVQEEECEGLCWQHIVTEEGIRPEFVVLTEPTDGNIYRGHRGRMDIRVEVKGVSCHGSAPERGINAIYSMSEIIQELQQLNTRLKDDPFLGKGTLAVTQIFYNSPSRCAIADMCSISIDRRLTMGEDKITAITQIQNLPSIQRHKASVTIDYYTLPSWTGKIYETENYFPTWITPEEHPACVAVMDTHHKLYGPTKIGKWTFSTNGVAIMGLYDIPCVGFGPGREREAHAPNEKTWKADLVKSAAVYAAIPSSYCKKALYDTFF